MAKKDFKSLTPEEVSALTGKEKAAYEKWLAKQSDNDPDNDNEEESDGEKSSEELVLVTPTGHQVNTSLYGHIYPGQKVKIGKALADQLIASGEVEITTEEEK